MRIRVSVPATAGLVGPAAEALGFALSLSRELIVDTERPGEGEFGLSRELLDHFEEATGKKVPPHRLTPGNELPFEGGLVAGLLAADALCETGLSRLRLLQLAVSLGGAAEHAAPAIYGGAVLSAFGEGGGPPAVVPLKVPAGWKAAVFLPDRADETREGRGARLGLLVAALLQDRPDLLPAALPPADDLARAAVQAGAWGAFRSGPSTVAFVPSAQAEGAAASMKERARVLGVPGRSLALDLSPGGARVGPVT